MPFQHSQSVLNVTVNLVTLLHKKLPVVNGQMLTPTSSWGQRTLMVSMVLPTVAGAMAMVFVLQRLSDVSASTGLKLMRTMLMGTKMMTS